MVAFGSDTTTHRPLFIDCGITFCTSPCDGITTSSFYKVNRVGRTQKKRNYLSSSLAERESPPWECRFCVRETFSLKLKVFPAIREKKKKKAKTRTRKSEQDEAFSSSNSMTHSRSNFFLSFLSRTVVIDPSFPSSFGLVRRRRRWGRVVCLDLTKKYYVNKQKMCAMKNFPCSSTVLCVVGYEQLAHTHNTLPTRASERWWWKEELGEMEDENSSSSRSSLREDDDGRRGKSLPKSSAFELKYLLPALFYIFFIASHLRPFWLDCCALFLLVLQHKNEKNAGKSSPEVSVYAAATLTMAGAFDAMNGIIRVIDIRTSKFVVQISVEHNVISRSLGCAPSHSFVLRTLLPLHPSRSLFASFFFTLSGTWRRKVTRAIKLTLNVHESEINRWKTKQISSARENQAKISLRNLNSRS